MRGFGEVLKTVALAGLLMAPLAASANFCEDQFKDFEHGKHKLPYIAANSEWYTYTDILNSFGIHVKIYSGFEKNLDHLGAVVLAFPTGDRSEDGPGHRTHEYMITKFKKVKPGLYRFVLVENPSKRLKGPLSRLKNFRDMTMSEKWDYWVKKMEGRAELEIEMDSTQLDDRETRVSQIRLKWDRHPVVPIYRTSDVFLGSYLHQENP